MWSHFTLTWCVVLIRMFETVCNHSITWTLFKVFVLGRGFKFIPLSSSSMDGLLLSGRYLAYVPAAEYLPDMSISCRDVNVLELCTEVGGLRSNKL
jgi:hypothetical protein